MGPLPATGEKASGAADRALSCRIGMPPQRIVMELGTVDHLDKEAVRDCVERL